MIVPSSNTTFEPEVRALCPNGVEAYATRIAFTPDERGLRDLKKHVRRASVDLSAEGLSDLIVFGCTVGSMVEGRGYDEGICAAIAATAGVPAITTTTAVVEAFRVLGVRTLALATPYTRKINEIESIALRDFGFHVSNVRGYYEDTADSEFTNSMIGRLSDEEVYRFALSVDTRDSDCLFISCTNLRTIGVIRYLEEKLKKPVLSSNICSIWLALWQLGISYLEGDLGARGCDCTLLRTLAPPPEVPLGMSRLVRMGSEG
ncbi:MAG: hypothetical protein SCH98_07150 [Deferrisomatales bacterium]|nr:hypothetical protein [Deferrisomatales bacterium]